MTPSFDPFIGGEDWEPQEDPMATIMGGTPMERLPVNMGGQPDDDPGMLMMDVDIDEVFGEFQGAQWDSDDLYYHDANLAQFMERGDLDRLAQNVISWVSLDRQSRSDWEQREADGIRKLGMSRADLEAIKQQVPGTEWRSTAVHSGLMQSCIQFWARAYTELFPAGGPAKAIVLGASDYELEQQARRVSGFLNYLFTQDMPGAAQEHSSALFRLPLSGSIFMKADFDPVLGTIVVKFLEAQDFIKPYSASDLGSSPRYTHIVRVTRNDLNRYIALGYYLNIDKGEPYSESSEHTQLDRVIDAATGISPVLASGDSDPEYADRDILYEMSVTLDLSDYGLDDPHGEGWEDPKTGRYVSIGVPYRVTVHKGEQRTLSIRRDWRKENRKKRRRRNVVEYKYLPGLGGYGVGLLHIAGGIADAQTGLTRYLLDGCTLDTTGKLSGFVSQSAVGMTGLPPFKLGEFQRVMGNAEDWQKQIWTPDFQWRPNNILETLQYLDKSLGTLVASTESMVGDENKNIPVGTILARIEQTSKPFAAIFSLLHASLTDELRAIADLAADYLPDRYPYAVEGADAEVFASDFDAHVDVVPVSDPNVVSSTQRMAQAQVVHEQASALFQMNPSPEVWQVVLQSYQYMLETLRVPTIDRFIPNPPAPQPPQVPQADPNIAKIARDDAVAQAGIERKDAETQARINRDAQRMRFDMARRQQGDSAIIAQEGAKDIDRASNEILDTVRARRMQMEGNANVGQGGYA